MVFKLALEFSFPESAKWNWTTCWTSIISLWARADRVIIRTGYSVKVLYANSHSGVFKPGPNKKKISEDNWCTWMQWWHGCISVAVWPSVTQLACLQEIFHSYTYRFVCPSWLCFITLLISNWLSNQLPAIMFSLDNLSVGHLWEWKHLAVSLCQSNCWRICVIGASRQTDSRLTPEHFFTDDNRDIYLVILIFLCIVCRNKLCGLLNSLRERKDSSQLTVCSFVHFTVLYSRFLLHSIRCSEIVLFKTSH